MASADAKPDAAKAGCVNSSGKADTMSAMLSWISIYWSGFMATSYGRKAKSEPLAGAALNHAGGAPHVSNSGVVPCE